MDFSLPQSVASIIERVSSFVRDELVPLERRFISRPFAELEPTLAEKRARAKELGLWAPHLPREVGGLGLSLAEFAPISEALGRTPLGHYVVNCQAPDAGNMEILLHFGTDEQKERFLVPLAAGEIRSCFAMTEPDRPGSNPTWLATTARREGDDYVIDGRKWFASSADGAAFAIVMAVTDPDAPRPHERASQFIVPAGTPGFEIVRNIDVMGHPGDGYASHSEVLFEGCRVPASQRLGTQGAGFRIAQERLGPGRIHHCMRWIGICERAFELMCIRAATRELAPGEPLGRRQMVQEWIADARAEIDAARLLVLRAAWTIDQRGSRGARDEITVIKFFVANVLQRVLDRAIQAHGALGLTDETPLAYWFRHERGARIYDGADEVHKSSLAQRILRQYGMESQ
jgi:acyl-CoA dehydrogenase